jgi:hypothetical protein
MGESSVFAAFIVTGSVAEVPDHRSAPGVRAANRPAVGAARSVSILRGTAPLRIDDRITNPIGARL